MPRHTRSSDALMYTCTPDARAPVQSYLPYLPYLPLKVVVKLQYVEELLILFLHRSMSAPQSVFL